ncbi:S-layer homology domain-containing protein [Cohnella abietis]|uniref:SLH domain-containing protein n=1 Tax=Cohnella abietis TaxID=2507935 RepID=A0A3T1DEJ3_9BACL|nr:S-layer homology domain-containing protein [Cohnella abietis]BBI36581.1 hypothetical protein KCTCHS21_59800 [Cohnella abietis]
MFKAFKKAASVALVFSLFLNVFPQVIFAKVESSSKEFLSFSVEGNPGVIDNVNHKINVVVPFRSAVDNMHEIFTVSEGASVLDHTSNVTRTNYSSPQTLTVVAEDRSIQVYTVTVTIGPSNLKSILSFNLSNPAVTGFIDDEAYAIFLTVPKGTDVTALKPTFTTDEMMAKVKVNDVVQVSGNSAQDFTQPLIYMVEALDGSTRDYRVTVNIQKELSTAKEITYFGLASLSSVGIIDETNHTIALTVPFGTNLTSLAPVFTSTGTGVYVNDVQQVSGEAVLNFTSDVVFTVRDEAGGTQSYTVKVQAAAADVSSTKAMLTYAVAGIQGTVNEDTHTITVVLPTGSSRLNQIATFTTNGQSIKIGTSVQSSGQTIDDFTSPVTYTVFAENGLTQNYVVKVVLANQLTSYDLISPVHATGVIDPVQRTITLDVQYGTDLSAAKATFVTTGDHLKINGIVQQSGVTASDLSLSPIIHAVDSENNAITYTLIVNRGLNPAKELTSFKLTSPESNGVVNQTTHTVSVTVPFGTDVTQLAPVFTSTGAEVKVGLQDQVSGVTTQDFTNPVTYSVYAADGNKQDYVVTVVVANQLKSFDLISPVLATGVIDLVQRTITLDVPYGTDLSAAKATFVTTGDHLKINGVVQQSGVTVSDLSLSPAIHAVDSDNQVIPYNLIINKGLNPAKELTSFKLTSPESNGVVNQTTHTVSITVPFGTDVTQLAPIFTTTGADVKVGLQNQVSGVTTQDFTNPVTYSVYAADGNKQDYVVTVTIAESAPSGGYNPPLVTPTEPKPTLPPATSIFKSVVDQAKIEAYLKGKVEQAQTEPVRDVFPDVNEHWSKANIDLFVTLGFLTGYKDGTFRPDASITRAEFAAIIAKVFHIEPASSSLVLKDVKDHWASQAIVALASNGIITGYGDDTFRPSHAITRAEIIAIISRIVDFKGVEKHQTASFNDVVGYWNSDEIQTAASAGIIEGRAAGTFAPNESSTRAEALSIIMRALSLNPDIKALFDQLKS